MRAWFLAAFALVACGGGASEQPANADSGSIPIDAAPPTPFGVRWARAGGDGASQFGYGIAFAKNGDIVMTGEYGGTIDLGAGPLDNSGGTTVSGFVTRLAENGRGLWSVRIGSTREASAYTVAIDASDHVYVGGYFKGDLEVLGKKLIAAGESDAFLVELDGAGKLIAAQRFGDAGSQAITAIAIDRDGSVLVAGDFDGSIDLGGGPLKNQGFADVFVARFDKGAHRFSRSLGGKDLDQRPRLAIGTDGAIFLSATYRGPIDLGGGPIVDRYDGGFLACLEPDGTHRWSKGFAGEGWFFSTSLSVAPDGRVAMGGRFTKSLDLGAGPLVSASGEDGVVAIFEPTGKLQRAFRYGGFGQDAVSGVAFDASGNLWITGETNETFGPLTSAGVSDLVVARLAVDGSFSWSSRFGDVVEQRGTKIAVSSKGAVAVVGSFFGMLDFSKEIRLVSNGGFDRSGGDAFVVMFDGVVR